jgi:predicted dithiol-disulfide oxidoreductase (DUF899 family)
MFSPNWTEGCPSCSSVADGYDGFRVHLEHHDVALSAVSRAPIEVLAANKRRMRWSFPRASSFHSDFNFDFGVSYTEEELAHGAEHNFRPIEIDPGTLPGGGQGVEPVDAAESPGVSAFVFDDDLVYTRIPPTPVARMFSGGCTSGWTGHRWVEMRAVCGFGATTNTTRTEPTNRRDRLPRISGAPRECSRHSVTRLST